MLVTSCPASFSKIRITVASLNKYHCIRIFVKEIGDCGEDCLQNFISVTIIGFGLINNCTGLDVVISKT